MSDDARAPLAERCSSVLLVFVLALALAEVLGHFVVRARSPARSDWARAAARVRADFKPGDGVVVAPAWADPLLREAAGDLLPVADAGRSDLAAHERVWEIAARGQRGFFTPPGDPAFEEPVGALMLRRWDLGPSPVLLDLVGALPEAEVSLGERSCRWRRQGRPGGGLGAGPLAPREAFFCGPSPWLFVGETVTEDLDLRPRRCVWQHPAGVEPVTTAYADVPFGERVVVYAGLYYEHERAKLGLPVDLEVRADGQALGRLRHQDGDGWKRAEMAMPEALRGGRGRLEVRVTAPNPHLRTLCWAATVRGLRRADELRPEGGS
ncbi:MAG: hypothetical protein AAF447_04325 [Myxococcota bacterium]